jgi:hypothetical protein
MRIIIAILILLMPVILNSNPNPQAVMLDGQHLSKILLDGKVVWQKYRPKPPATDELSLESLEHRRVKLTATNDKGTLFFPMFFPPRQRTDHQHYLDRLTFIGDAELSLQSIDATLVAEVKDGKRLYFPMVFPVNRPTSRFEFLDRLTFIDKDGFGADAWEEFNVNVIDPAKDFISTVSSNLDSV